MFPVTLNIHHAEFVLMGSVPYAKMVKLVLTSLACTTVSTALTSFQIVKYAMKHRAVLVRRGMLLMLNLVHASCAVQLSRIVMRALTHQEHANLAKMVISWITWVPVSRVMIYQSAIHARAAHTSRVLHCSGLVIIASAILVTMDFHWSILSMDIDV